MRKHSTREFATKAGSVVLATALGAIMIPAAALAQYNPTQSNRVVVTTDGSDSYGITKTKTANPDGTFTATYTNIVNPAGESDFSPYALTSTFTYDATGKVTKLDISSPDLTFAGSWGYNNDDPVDGYLPDGCSFSVTKDGDAFVPSMTVPANYGSTVKQVALATVDATTEANKATWTNQIVTTGGGKGGGTAKTTYGDWNPETQKLMLSAANAGVNLVRFTYNISADSNLTFYTYFAIAADGSVDTNKDSVANKYLDGIQATAWTSAENLNMREGGQSVYGSAMTNRFKWAEILSSIYLQREIPSWNAYLTTEAAGELEDLDTISGATRTSIPVIAALEEFVKDRTAEGLTPCFAENLKMTLDALCPEDTTDVTANPAIQTKVTKNADGKYVLDATFLNGLYNIMPSANVTVAELTYFTYDKKLTTTETCKLAKQELKGTGNGYTAKTGRGADTSVTWTAKGEAKGDTTTSESNVSAVCDASKNNAVFTINDSSITHVALSYSLKGIYVNLVYDLASMYEAEQVNEQIAALATTHSAALVQAAREAYNALTIETRYCVTNIDTLLAAEANIVDLSKATVKASACTYTGKAQKPAVTVTVNGQKVDSSLYTVAYSNNTKAGTAKVTVTAAVNKDATGSATASFTIKPAANKLVAKNATRTVKAGKASKKIAVSAKSALSYKKVSGKAGITVVKATKGFKVKVAKSVKKGTYKVKVKVSAAKGNFTAASKTITIKVKVKK